MTRRKMLCSGTGGPRKTGLRVLTCPVCGSDDFGGYPATRHVVPRHFLKHSAVSPAALEAAAALAAASPDAERAAVSV